MGSQWFLFVNEITVKLKGIRVTLHMSIADGVVSSRILQPYFPVIFLSILTASSISMINSLAVVSESNFVHEFGCYFELDG